MTLENLVKIHQLNQEPPDKKELEGLLMAAKERLTDSQNKDLSFSSRFDLAYSAAHGFSLGALRAKGYRSDKRYLVFQCLNYTSAIDKVQQRIFSICHERRNLAEYEGHYEVDENLLSELIKSTKLLMAFTDNIRL